MPFRRLGWSGCAFFAALAIRPDSRTRSADERLTRSRATADSQGPYTNAQAPGAIDLRILQKRPGGAGAFRVLRADAGGATAGRSSLRLPAFLAHRRR
jgi:hypothetical protein